MKTTIRLIFALLLTFALVSCGTTGSSESSNTTEEHTSEEHTTEEHTTEEHTAEEHTTEEHTSEEHTTEHNETTTETEQEPIDKISLLNYLSELLQSYKWHPSAVIPDSMLPCAEQSFNSVDYGFDVPVSDIPTVGFGEQWNMVADNLSQSEMFFEILNACEGVITTAVSVYNNYLDTNPADTMHFSFESGIYSATIDCDEDNIYYALEYVLTINEEETTEETTEEETEEETQPIEIKIQIALSMDLKTNDKTVRVQFGDDNALIYTVTENSYTLCIKYLNLRATYFTISLQEDGSFVGHIQEYLGTEAINIESIADFYIDEDFITVVGNKASGIPGFKGYICEIYDAKNGKLIGYEVRESLEEFGDLTFNTLWFNLEDIEGIESIRFAVDPEDEKEKFFVNGKATPWESKFVGGISGKMLSRRFDIEFRTQYLYSYDEESNSYSVSRVKIPMMFIQEEMLEDFVKDVKSTNKIQVSIGLDEN